MTAANAQNALPAEPLAAAAPQTIRQGVELIGQKLDGWLHDFILLIPNLIGAAVTAILFLVLAWGLAAALRHTVKRSGRHDLARMLASFAYWGVLFFGFLVVMTIMLPSMRPVDIFASLGIGSVALGFAFKDILQNWIAGFFILIRRPFHRGDQIKVGDIEGTVQAVETRATLVKTYSGRLVIIPNSEIYTRAVTVHTAYENRRTEIVVPVGLEADLELAIEVFRGAVEGVENVLADPAPDVLPWEFKDNNIDIRVRWWIKSQRTYEVHTRAAVVLAIKRASEKAGITLPADTKISFADTPLVIGRATRREELPQAETPAPVPLSSADAALTEREVAKTGDERSDPEAETPKVGELNKGVAAMPR